MRLRNGGGGGWRHHEGHKQCITSRPIIEPEGSGTADWHRCPLAPHDLPLSIAGQAARSIRVHSQSEQHQATSSIDRLSYDKVCTVLAGDCQPPPYPLWGDSLQPSCMKLNTRLLFRLVLLSNHHLIAALLQVLHTPHIESAAPFYFAAMGLYADIADHPGLQPLLE